MKRPGPNSARPILRFSHLACSLCWLTACTDSRPTRPPTAGDGGGLDATVAMPRDPGLGRLVDWNSLPVLGPGKTAEDSSRDRSETAVAGTGSLPGNKDFDNFVAVCNRPQVFLGRADGTDCEPGIDGYVLSRADDGPGVLTRIFIAAAHFDGGLSLDSMVTGFVDERLKVYVDGASEPVLDAPLSELAAGTRAPFVSPLAVAQSGAFVSYVPMGYRSKVRVVLDSLRPVGTVYYYQVDRTALPDAVPFDEAALASAPGIQTFRADVAAPRGVTTWVDADVTVLSGETTQVLDRSARGTIRGFELSGNVGPAILSDVHLLAAWDGAATPAIDVPVSALFGAEDSVAPYDTLPLAVSLNGDVATFSLRLPMPFGESATVALRNDGPSDVMLRARVSGTDTVPEAPFGTLHGVFTDRSAPTGSDSFPLISTTGRGKYVATVLHLRGGKDSASTLPSPFNFLEGDDFATADGVPVLRGTGTEEYFDGGWYFQDGPFSSTFSAVVARDSSSLGEGRVTAVRFHPGLNAPSFDGAFDLAFEYGAKRPESAHEYRGVALFYLSP